VAALAALTSETTPHAAAGGGRRNRMMRKHTPGWIDSRTIS
jgi:hypothetical protein